MDRRSYLETCLNDAISALNVSYPSSTIAIKVGDDYIYPAVALERLKSIKNVDKLFPPDKE